MIAADKPGILFHWPFLRPQGITIENLQSTRYRAMQTGAEMFSTGHHRRAGQHAYCRAARRFPEFCDHLNLDAIMDP